MKPAAHDPQPNAPQHARRKRPGLRSPSGGGRHKPLRLRRGARALSALAVWVYALVLTVGVMRLAQGEAAWNGWLQALRTPLSLALHLVLLLGMVVHSYCWFEDLPRTLTPWLRQGARGRAKHIQRTGWSMAVLVGVLALALAFWSQT